MTEVDVPETSTNTTGEQPQPGFIRRLLNGFYTRTFGRLFKWIATWKFNQYLMAGAGFLVLITICPFFFALLAGTLIDLEAAAAFFAYFRDLVSIMMSLQVILIITAIAILIAQIAWFVNLLSSEVKPIMKDTREAIQNVRVTTEFAGEQVTDPLIKIQSFFAGLTVFLREIFRFGRVVRSSSDDTTGTETGAIDNDNA